MKDWKEMKLNRYNLTKIIRSFESIKFIALVFTVHSCAILLKLGYILSYQNNYLLNILNISINI